VGGAQRVIEEDEDEITTVHSGEPLLSPDAVSPVRPRPFAAPRLHGARPPVVPVPQEETVLLPADPLAPPGAEARSLRPSDQFGWGTVVLPGGGHPDHVERTRILAVDGTEEPIAAISTTARLSLGAPDHVDAVDSTTLTGIRRPAPVEPLPASSMPIRGPAPEAWAIPRVGLARPPTGDRRPAAAPTEGGATLPGTGGRPAVPVATLMGGATLPGTGGHPVVPVAAPMDGGATLPGTGGHPVAPVAAPTGADHPAIPPSGGHPLAFSGPHPLGPASTGNHPVIARPAARGRGRVLVPTGAHPGPRTAPDDTRLAWGFLLGVLITVAIVSVAVALGLYLVQ
jgi:hypothetical protein